MPDPVETELTLAPRNDDVRMPPPGGAAANEEPTPNPVELLLDRLHGRWLWVGLTAAVLAPALAVAGYLFTPVIYSAQGIVEIERQLETITTPTPETASMNDFSGFVMEQTVFLRSDRVVEAAMGDARLGPYAQRLAQLQAGAILSGLSVSPVKGTGIISVQIDSDDPRFASAAVDAILDAYLRLDSPDAKVSLEAKQKANRDNLAVAQRKIETANEDLLALLKGSPYGTANLQGVIEERVRAFQKKEAELGSIEQSMQRIRESLPHGDGAAEPADDARLAPAPGELEQANPNLPAVRHELSQARMQLELASKNYGAQHPINKNAHKKVELLEDQLRKEETLAFDAWKAGVGRTVSYGELRTARTQTLAMLERIREEINQLNETIAKADKIKRVLAQATEDEKRFSERLKELEAETDAIKKGRVSVRHSAVPSLPSKDRRKQIALAGGAGGIAVSVAFFFLLGTLDRRTFGTRQLVGSNPGKLLCAGALPDMNAIEGEADTKDLASNCVHRIRTRIESRRAPGDGYALMVSSPFQGDGKTTLAVALAWSYAESGYRTLLVDCDFIGQALSFQFGHLGVAGVREALQGEDPTSLIAAAGPSLWILPVGRDRHFGASRVHPTGLRRLFRELRNRYDVIIIDTGPMTASIEALPVASAVDGVVLSLRRGRSRQRLDECIADIGSVGAEYLGVVLNYADRKDCMRYGSVSRISVEVTKALEGKQPPAPKHPLLAAISAQPPAPKGEHRREGDAA